MKKRRDIIRLAFPAQKGGETNTPMKYLAIIALAAAAFGLGACKSKEPAPTTPPPSSHGYSK